MENYPKISVITPSYNQDKFIERTIISVISQKYPNLEYIIKDAGSTDKSLSIIKAYAKKYPKVIKWISKKDRGQAHGINQGLKMATGEIFTYLNSDDTYNPGTLKSVGRFFNKHKDAMWVTGDYSIVDENDRKIQSFVVFYKRLWRSLTYFWSLAIANYIIQPSTFWKRKLVKEIGYFDETQHLVLDYDYWLRIIQKYPLKVINKPLSNFRIHSSSKGKSGYKTQFIEGYEIIKRYTNNPIFLILHKVHAWLIILIYKIIK